MLKLRGVYQLVATASMFICSTIAHAKKSHTDAEQNTATLRVRFMFEGNVPAPDSIAGSRDPFCAECEIADERLIVSDARELQNVVLLWDERKNAKLSSVNPEAAPGGEVGITNVGCRLEPRIIVERVGQELVLENDDETGHNTNQGNRTRRCDQVFASGVKRQDFDFEFCEFSIIHAKDQGWQSLWLVKFTNTLQKFQTHA